jgi:hypothetical protein
MKKMDHKNNQLKYRANNSVSFADEIIIGKAPIISKSFDNFSDIDLFPKEKSKTQKENQSQNYMLHFSLLSFALIAFLIILSKIVTSNLFSFNNFSTSFFVLGYFLLFALSVYLISKRKVLSLKVKDNTLYLKSFPSLNKKIPINQIIKCELNTINNGKYSSENKLHFALNENGNRYKQPLTSGVSLQLIDGQHIIIGSYKS